MCGMSAQGTYNTSRNSAKPLQKIRCIGTGEPPCQNCLEAGVECIYVEGKKRGPAKGYFDVITKRFASLFTTLIV